MSNQKRKVERWFISVIMLASLLCVGYAAAENNDNPQQTVNQGDEQADDFEESTYIPPADIEEKLQSLKMPQLERKYLTEKYPGLEKKETFSTLEQTEYGPIGYLHISGKIAPKGGWGSALEGKEKKEERARTIARAFIVEEASSLFGAIDAEEFKEVRFNKDEDSGFRSRHLHILYKRYIGGLPIKNAYINVHIGPDETISSLEAEVVAPVPALYQAAGKKTIGKGKIFKIVRDSLKSSDPEVSVGVSKAQKEAILDSPYVIWNVEATSIKPAGGGMREWQWEFKIDAFTGEIIQMQERPRDSGANPW